MKWLVDLLRDPSIEGVNVDSEDSLVVHSNDTGSQTDATRSICGIPSHTSYTR
jgi:hypothetical protein